MSLRCVWRLGLRGKASCNERPNRVSIWVRWQGPQVSKSRPGAPFAFADTVGVDDGQVVPLLRYRCVGNKLVGAPGLAFETWDLCHRTQMDTRLCMPLQEG